MGKSNWEDSSNDPKKKAKKDMDETLFNDFKAIKVKEDKVLKLRITNEEIYRKKYRQLREKALKSEHEELDSYERAKEEALKRESEYRKQIGADATQEELDQLDSLIASRKQAEDKVAEYRNKNRESLQQLEKDARKSALNSALQIEGSYYKKLSVFDKQKFLEDRKRDQLRVMENLKRSKLTIDAEIDLLDQKQKEAQKLGEELSKDDKARLAELRAEQTEHADSILALNNSLTENEKERANLSDIVLQAQLSYLSAKEQEEALNELIKEGEEDRAKLRKEQLGKMIERDEIKVQLDSAEEGSDEYAKLLEEFNRLNDVVGDLEDQIDESVKASKNLTKTLEKTAGQRLTDQRKAANEEKKKDLQARKDALKTKEGRDALKEEGALQHEEEIVSKKEDSLRAYGKDMAALKDGSMAMNAGAKALQDLAKSIDTNIASMYEYQGHLEARLQGAATSGKEAILKASKLIGFSGVVSQKEVVAKIKDAVDHGIAYNVELRAFLATTAENIANTFDVFDSNLLRLIRLQQVDSTAARMGMEATLTKLFNSTFSDTSYLSDAADTVAQAILDASSQLTKENSLQFEYIVQKWLGALYSVGFSSEAVSTIAEGINYLGTGNVEALNGNDQLQTLMAMSAYQAGLPYAEILTEGLDPSKTNDLLKSMIEYLQSIANNTDNNQVTKQAYTNLLGISMSDLVAIQNLHTSDIETLYNNSTSYADSLTEIQSQMGQMVKRIHLSKIIDTAFENIMVDVATNIGSTGVTYGLWKALNVVEGLTGGFNIPAIGIMGNMVDLDTTVTSLGKLGMAGLSLIGSIIGGIAGGSLFGTNDLSSWGNIDGLITRGSSKGKLNSGMASGTSESSSLVGTGSASGDDVKTTSMSDATDEADKDKDITNKNVEGIGQTELQNIRDAVWESEADNVLQALLDIRARMDSPFLTLGGGGGGGGTSTSTSGAATAAGGLTKSDLADLFSQTTFKTTGGSSGGSSSSTAGTGTSVAPAVNGLTKTDLSDLFAQTVFSTTGATALEIAALLSSGLTGSTSGSTNPPSSNNPSGAGNNVTSPSTVVTPPTIITGITKVDLADLFAQTTFKTDALSTQDIQNLRSSIFQVEVLSITSNNTTGNNSSNSTNGGTNTSNSTNSLVNSGMTTIIDSSSLLTPLNQIVQTLEPDRLFKTSIEMISSTATSSNSIVQGNQNNNNGSTSSQINNLANQLNNANAQNSVNSTSNNSTTNVVVDNFSSTFSTGLQTLIYNAVLHALTTHYDNTDDAVKTMLSNVIAEVLEDAVVETKVTNDYLDTVLQKQAFSSN